MASNSPYSVFLGYTVDFMTIDQRLEANFTT